MSYPEPIAEGLAACARARQRPMVMTRGSTVDWAFFPSPYDVPKQGWKLHISCALAEAQLLLQCVVDQLLAQPVAFKIAANERSWIALNAGMAGVTQVGKIVTVYPTDDAQLMHLHSHLIDLWPRSCGPALHADRFVSASGHMGIRYGIFTKTNMVVDAQGMRRACLRQPDGSLLPDQRGTHVTVPAWAAEPPLKVFPQTRACG